MSGSKPGDSAGAGNASKSRLYNTYGLFTIIPDYVMDMAPELGAQPLVLWAYLYRYNRDHRGTVYPSYKTMRKELGWTRNAIAKAIRALLSCGALGRKKRFGDSTMYFISPAPPSSMENRTTDGMENRTTDGMENRTLYKRNTNTREEKRGAPLRAASSQGKNGASKPKLSQPPLDPVELAAYNLRASQLEAMIDALCAVLHRDATMKGNRAGVTGLAHEMMERNHTAESIKILYGEDGEGGEWARSDWRGKQGEHPGGVSVIRTTYKELVERRRARRNGNRSGGGLPMLQGMGDLYGGR